MNSSPLVSIGLPVRNGERFLDRALESLRGQDFNDFELIVSDNASTDQTQDICRQYVARDRRVRYCRNETNLGAIENFRRTFQLSAGKYFMWAACDDLWAESYVSTMLGNLISNPDAALAFSAFNNVDEQETEVRTYPFLFDLPSSDLFQRLWNYMLQEEYQGKANPIYGLMRRDAMEAAGGVRVWGKGLWGADMLIVFKLLSLGNLVLSEELLFHKRHC
ncbi:MAG: glycosyltransferase [Candidatus Marsarchaeota archaeon]|nr:glycosyltransferase [Candidatus Marsarchaeota archaeon]